MKSFRRLFWIVGTLMCVLLLFTNLYLFPKSEGNGNRAYMVEINRIAHAMELNELDEESIDLSSYQYVKRIVLCENEESLFENSRYDVCLKQINGKNYRFEYQLSRNLSGKYVVLINGLLVVVFAILFFVLGYIYRQIIKPFSKMEQIPYELAKGNLTLELTENRSKYFGRYIWGTNMLRESIEEKRKNELSLHREKKTLLLSLTHDIKTPLSVIRLNAQALSHGLYQDKEKQKEAASSIISKVDEMEMYVSKMIEASREDFLHFTVKDEDFYLSELMSSIQEYYEEKLALHHTKFLVDNVSDCILRGDLDRCIEVLQNLMENAIKYGDGDWIRISFEREEDCRLITVSNSGCTLRLEDMPHLFDSFFRGSNVTNEPGSGLGLYICRQLMNEMNGEIYGKQKDGVFFVTMVIREA